MANTSKHTPAPWRIDHALVIAADGSSVAIIASTAPGVPLGMPVDWPVEPQDADEYDAESEANACLITAAPALLEALKGIIRHAAHDTSCALWDTRAPAACDCPMGAARAAALAAIVLAEGA